jgi:type I restriction enzyme S subunit
VKADWKKSTLGNVLSTLKNGLNCKQTKDAAGQKISRIESISTASFDINRVGFSEISESDKAKFQLLKGDILFSHINSPIHVGKTATFNEDEDVYHGVNLLQMRPNEEVLPAYLELYLKCLFESGYWLKRCKQSVNQASVNQQDIAQVAIEFPSNVIEQHRIVTLLDETFADIATAKANAEKNLQNARALFKSHLDASFGQRNESWTEKALQDIGSTQTGSTPKTSDQANYGDELPFIKPGDFAPDGTLNYENDGLSAQGAASARKVSANSVLMVCIGATIGKCGYADREIATNQQINAFTPVAGVDKKFIYYQMLTKRFQDRVIHSSGQATLPIINKSKWSALTIYLPGTLGEQEAIAKKMDFVREETQRLESIYRQKLNALDDLKKSLLHQAFSGQL